jgi:hypothetical protein
MAQARKSSGMSRARVTVTTVVPAVVAVCWLALPFTVGDAVASALGDRSTPVVWVAATGLWLGWAVGAGAIVIARTSGLTIARYVVPGAAAVAVWATADASEVTPVAVAGLVAATVAASLVLTAAFGDRSVNGSSYGAERRFALRPPTAVVLGPLPLLWVVVAAGVTAGPLLLAARVWVAGAVALVVGWPLAAAIVRRTHVLSRRWLVLVPAGVVVHDPLVLVDSLLVQKANLASLGPALADTTATDLTMGAVGLAVEVHLRTPSSILTHAERRAAGGSLVAAGTEVDAVLVTPSRPGAVMRTVTERHLPVR